MLFACHLSLSLSLFEILKRYVLYSGALVGNVLFLTAITVFFCFLVYVCVTYLLYLTGILFVEIDILGLSCSLYFLFAALFLLAPSISGQKWFNMVAMYSILIFAAGSIYIFAVKYKQAFLAKPVIVLIFSLIPIILFEIVLVQLTTPFLRRVFNDWQIVSAIIRMFSLFLLGITVYLFWKLDSPVLYRISIAIITIICIVAPGVFSAGRAIFVEKPKRYDTRTAQGVSPEYVVLITVDTLRADALSCYNSSSGVDTVNMDSIAKDGVIFRHALSPAPWTLTALASIISGLSGFEHGAIKRDHRLSESHTTVAEVLREAGYHTASIGYNIYGTERFNLHQGFDDYQWFPKPKLGTFAEQLLQKFSLRVPIDHFNSTENLTRLTISWLKRNHDRPFFLWLHYFDPHIPYRPPQRFIPDEEPPERIGNSFNQLNYIRAGTFVPDLEERNWIKTLYNAEVKYVDEEIGKVISVLKRYHIYENALLILTGDHGEEFWEHNGYGHGHTLYDEVLGIPLLIKPPSSLNKPHREVSAFVSTQSLMPTILEYCRIPLDQYRFTVPSLVPYINSENNEPEHKPVYSTGMIYFTPKDAVVIEKFKYIEDRLDGQSWLYDLENDPDENKPLSADFSEKIELSKRTLNNHLKIAEDKRKSSGARDAGKVTINKDTANHLKSLGYIQ